MTVSSEVFALRKAGALDQAYALALSRADAEDRDAWDDKALAWCLIDLMKAAAKAQDGEKLGEYRRQLEAISIAEDDLILRKQRDYVYGLIDPTAQVEYRAKQLVKAERYEEGEALYRQLWQRGAGSARVGRDFAQMLQKMERHDEAVAVSRTLLTRDPENTEIQMALGWALYRLAKAALDRAPEVLVPIKRALHEYLQISSERPSILHSRILWIAHKLSKSENFSMVGFVRLWGLEHLREEDWERFVTEDKQELPSLAEGVLQTAAKEAAKRGDREAAALLLPALEGALQRVPENLWMTLYKAKLLALLGREEEALQFAVAVARAKSGDYWAWELLGDLFGGGAAALREGCYCRALLCKVDDAFSGKVRMKLGTLWAERGLFAEAKYEYSRVYRAKREAGVKVPPELEEGMSAAWFASAPLLSSNDAAYRAGAAVVEEHLNSLLPWTKANLGERFTPQGQSPRWKLYLQSEEDPVEVVLPLAKLAPPEGERGAPIRVKGEWDAQGRFQVYQVSPRPRGKRWDVFPLRQGVVDSINPFKRLLHFYVSRLRDGVISLAELSEPFEEGDGILLRLSTHHGKDGVRSRVVTAERSETPLPVTVRRDFRSVARVHSAGFAFTDSDIFIPPPLVERARVEDGDEVEGVALHTYNRSKGEWGWKAISLRGSREGMGEE